ncbi:MAG: hypothetical protein WBM24_18255 [Candidatus Sulfotelmatobacter sp.]
MIAEFAAAHRLKSVRDGEGEDIERVVIGRIGQSSIYEYSETELAVSFMTDGRKAPRTGLFNIFKADCLEAGMTPRQIGDAEGSFSFDPNNSKQAKVAIQGIRAKVRRQLSPEQAQAGAARLVAARLAKSLAEVHT